MAGHRSSAVSRPSDSRALRQGRDHAGQRGPGRNSRGRTGCCYMTRCAARMAAKACSLPVGFPAPRQRALSRIRLSEGDDDSGRLEPRDDVVFPAPGGPAVHGPPAGPLGASWFGDQVSDQLRCPRLPAAGPGAGDRVRGRSPGDPAGQAGGPWPRPGRHRRGGPAGLARAVRAG